MNDSAPLSEVFCKHATDSNIFIFFLIFELFYVRKHNLSSGAFSHLTCFKQIDENKKNMKDATFSGIFAQTRQSDWRICTAPLIMARYHSYFKISI
jgi:hypothetical protein